MRGCLATFGLVTAERQVIHLTLRQQMTYCLGEPISLHRLFSDYTGVGMSPDSISWLDPTHPILAFSIF